MKKRILAFLLAVAAVVSLMVAPAYAAGVENVTDTDSLCPCGCGETMDRVNWQPWAGNPNEGHYYLDENYIQKEQIIVLSDNSVVLDLRGNTITTEITSRLFLVNGYLHVLDTVGGGRMMAKTPSGDNGGVVLVEENESLAPAFYLHSGTITPDPASGKAGHGGLVHAGNGGRFCMRGGLLLKGHSGSEKNGGAVSGSATSSIEILGGSLVGGTAGSVGGNLYSAGAVTLKDCSLIGGQAGTTGGNLYISGTLTAENCIIAGGTAASTGTYGGGNVNTASGSKLTFTNCEIYGGYCPGYGGNISFGWGTQTLINTKVYGGVSGKGGDNIALTHASANMTLTDCTVDGGIGRVLGKVTLKGATKISANNGGLNLADQNQTADKPKTTTATGLTAGAEVYVQGAKSLSGNLEYIKPALRTALSASGNAITGTLASNGAEGYCPHCDRQVAWNAYGTENPGSHIYLTADVADFNAVVVSDALVVDLAGFDITAPGRAFYVEAAGNLTVVDSVGGGIITGSGVASESGGVIYNAGSLKLYGGEYVYAKNASNEVLSGGVIYNAGTMEVNGSILDGRAFDNYTMSTNCGGVVELADGETVTLTMTGSHVKGGKAYSGGGLHCGYNNVVNITYSYFVDGKAVTGGNISAFHDTASRNGTLNITGSRITGGQADTDGVTDAEGKSVNNYGGNVYIGRYNANLTDCYIADGEAALYGGNLNVSATTDVVLENCILTDGDATAGGNCYGPGRSTKVCLKDCLLTDGTASTGGNLSLNNGSATVVGGEISYGVATAGGGNIYAGSANNTGLTIQADEKGNAPLVCHGTAGTNGGNLYIKGFATITDAFIHSGTAVTSGEDLYVTDTATKLTLGAGLTGNVHMCVYKTLLTSNVYGGAISNITCNASNANFYMDGSYGDCKIVVDNGTMYVPEANVIDAAGNATGYITLNEAVEACEAGSYVKLFTSNELVLTKDLYVDLNGKTVNVSENGYAFYGMDSTGDGYTEPAGAATGVTAQTYDVVNAPNGNRYIAIVNDGAAAYHRLGMQITGVTIRPSEDGMYYTAKWSCDDTLKALISNYGIVTSLVDMPDESFAADETNLWTALGKDTFQSGAAKNSALIRGILRTLGAADENGNPITAEKNSEYGKTPVYAKAYISFENGPTLVGTENTQFSLYQLMKALDKLIMEKPIQYRKFNLTARNFYEKWKEGGMGDWKLSKIPMPADDGIIDVLMVGNSWCYYFVEELHALAKASGVNMRVCNVYYSGCPIDSHYDWWQNGKSKYQYYETYTDGRKEKGNGVSLEWCLAQREWDVITMNLGGSEMRTMTAEQISEKNLSLAKALFQYFGESFPKADLYMHQSWAYELGYEKKYSKFTFKIETVEDQKAYTEKTRQVISAICEDSGVGRINTGDAWEFYRDACMEAGIESNLCARLGNNNNQGDKGHDGDIGGGQYLNALVWFEILTGKDCRDTTYIPTYTYDKQDYPMDATMAQMLQEAAHKAASEKWYTYPENAN